MTRQQTILLHRWLVVLPVLVAAGLVTLALLAPERVSGAPDIVPIAEAHQMARNGDWDAAMYHTRQYLLEHPEDPFGHFLLGQCYLYGPRLQVVHADGELETALALHRRLGHIGGMEGQLTPEDFVYRIYKIRAVVQLRIVREGMVLQLPPYYIERELRDCLVQLREALKAYPGDEFLEGMQTEVRGLLEELEIEVDEADEPAFRV